jgi:hypothetical protein
MAQREQHGARDLSYSAWHRAAPIRRIAGWERAQLISMVDADCVLFLEYHDRTKEPLALIEAAIDVGQNHKPASAITRLAQRARLPAYALLYRRAPTFNPADPRWQDIAEFRVKRLWPGADTRWRSVKPDEWANALLQIRAWSARRLDVEAANDPQLWEARPMTRANARRASRRAVSFPRAIASFPYA